MLVHIIDVGLGLLFFVVGYTPIIQIITSEELLFIIHNFGAGSQGLKNSKYLLG